MPYLAYCIYLQVTYKSEQNENWLFLPCQYKKRWNGEPLVPSTIWPILNHPITKQQQTAMNSELFYGYSGLFSWQTIFPRYTSILELKLSFLKCAIFIKFTPEEVHLRPTNLNLYLPKIDHSLPYCHGLEIQEVVVCNDLILHKTVTIRSSCHCDFILFSFVHEARI